MDYADNIKFNRLLDKFYKNYRLTELYSQYLSHFPCAITKEMIDTLTSGGELTKEEAVAAILTELFGLSYDNTEDRSIIRDYLPRSIKILDTKKYTENPYYKNIKIADKKIGSWEIKTERYEPYRAFIADDMTLYEDNTEFATLGFFDEEFFFPAVLEGGNEWMTLTPVDLDTCEEAIEKAIGKVVTFGLGLGYYAYRCCEKPEVDSITVVEKSENVIKLFSEEILPQFSHPEKLHIVSADAFEYAEKVLPNEKFNLAFVDIWRDAYDGLFAYDKMKPLEKLSPNTEFLYWIEGFILSRKRSLILEELKAKYENDSLSSISYEEIKKMLFLN